MTEPIPCPECHGYGKMYYEYILPKDDSETIISLLKLDRTVSDFKLNYSDNCKPCKGTGIFYKNLLEVTH